MENKNNIAILNANSLPISTKYSIEICMNIRGKEFKKAYRLLEDVVSMKRALKIRRHNFDLGHKAGLGPASFPIKASEQFLKLLDSIKSNAENKGLNSESLVITFAKADKAEARYRGGRKGRQKAKSTHVQLIVEEKAKEVKVSKEEKK